MYNNKYYYLDDICDSNENLEKLATYIICRDNAERPANKLEFILEKMHGNKKFREQYCGKITNNKGGIK